MADSLVSWALLLVGVIVFAVYFIRWAEVKYDKEQAEYRAFWERQDRI